MSFLTEISFNRVAEAFLESIRHGDPITPEQLAEEFPQFRKQIFTELPAMELLERALTAANGQGSEPSLSLYDDPKSKPAFDLPGYEFLEELGRGAVGYVFKARHLISDRVVAVKLIANSHAQGISQRIGLEKEAMERLGHPHIVPIFSHGSSPQFAYIVMKWIDGFSLEKLLIPNSGIKPAAKMAEIRENWRELAAIGRQVALGLEHAHKRGLIHRDIKPANLILDSDNKTWIADFGLAKIVDYMASLSNTGDIIGTPRYMAPEQVRGIADHRSDIYSLGRTLFAIASDANGKLDFSVSQQALSIREVNPDVPSDLAFIIDKACQFDPEKRYQSAAELSLVLNRFARKMLPSDRRQSKNRPTDDVFRKRKQFKKLAAMALAGTLLVSLAVWSVLGSNAQNSAGQIVGDSASAATLDETLSTKDVPNMFIAELLDGEADFVDVIGDAIKNSIVASDQTSEENSEKVKSVANKIDQVVEKVKQEGIHAEKLNRISDGFRESNLPIIHKIAALAGPLQATRLPAAEKEAGLQTIYLFSKSVANGQISADESERILASLFEGRIPRLEYVMNARIESNAFRSWLHLVNQTLGYRLQNVAHERIKTSETIEGILNHFLENN